jgi:hypothetical protein
MKIGGLYRTTEDCILYYNPDHFLEDPLDFSAASSSSVPNKLGSWNYKVISLPSNRQISRGSVVMCIEVIPSGFKVLFEDEIGWLPNSISSFFEPIEKN